MNLLRKRLAEINPALSARLQVVETKARQVLEYVHGGAHMTFTAHGFSHISAVEENYDWLLSDEDVRSFDAMELFCLLCATFFHDAMMMPRRVGEEETARQNHAAEAETFLLKQKELLGLSIHEASTIGQVILGHAVSSLEKIRREIALGRSLVNIHKLAACLSMADICHADSSRVPEIVFQHLDLDEESSRHWRRHLQISGITRKDNQLIVSAHYFSDEGLQAVTEYKGYIENQLRIVRPYFNSVLRPFASVELQAQRLKSQLDVTLRFQANTSAILDILIEGVYQRTDVFLRELVQNSLDACHLRLAKTMKRTERYQPRTVISLLKESGKLRGIRVDDNGIGMDVHDVQDTVLWIGNSISHRNDVKTLLSQTTQKHLIATFGIGLLSCFKASEKIVVRSAKEDRESVQFSVTSVTNAIRPTEASDRSIGTTFLIEFREEAASELELEKAVTHYFRLVQAVPIELLTLEWGEQARSYTRDEVFRISSAQGTKIGIQSIGVASERFCIKDIKGEDFVAWIWLPKPENTQTLPVNEGTIIVLNEGVFVCSDNSSDWLPKCFKACHGVINFGAKAVDLPVARDKVISNKKATSKRTEISLKAYTLIDELVNLTSAENVGIGDSAALFLASFITENADTNEKILLRLDNYCVREAAGRRTIRLHEIFQDKPVYVEYFYGNFVQELTVLDGKQLWHKPDDLTELQAAILRQAGRLVIRATRSDSSSSPVLEFDLLKLYFKRKNVSAIDLTNEKRIIGRIQAKPLPKSVRAELNQKVRFVELPTLPNKRGWRVGNETWLNVAAPKMSLVYNTLQSDSADDSHLRLARLLIDIHACRFEEAATDILSFFAQANQGAE